jgi:hypothetical protein
MLEIGSSLREERRRRGLELADVEAVTLIRERYLAALEREQFDVLPLGAYRRSFLREYAEFLGLDGEVYATEYDLRLSELEPEPPTATRHAGTGVAELLNGRPPTRAVAALAVAVVLVLGGVALWQLEGSAARSSAPPRPPVAHKRSPPRSSARSHPPTVVKHPRAQSHASLTLTAARGACWLLVRSGSSAGRTLVERTLQPGQSVRFGLLKPLWIRLGAPWNLNATLDGRTATARLPAHTGDFVANSSGLRASA